MKRVPLIHIIIATGFGSGFSPFAPGTAGALLATLIWLALSCAVSPTLLLIITALLIGIFTIAGIRSANAVEPIWGEDPSRVVVDEMVGVWIPLWQHRPVTCGMHWQHSRYSACSIFSSRWVYAKWNISREESE